MADLSHICDTIIGWLQHAPTPPPWDAHTWEAFQGVCQVHGVAPLLWPHLNGVNWLPVNMQRWLQAQHHLNNARHIKLQADLQAILGLFAQHQLAVMPLKGSILATRFYPDAALRPMADLDILLQPADFETAAALLAQLGYEQTTVHWKHTAFIKPHNQTVVSNTGEHPDNPRPVEVHLACRETFGGPTITLTELLWHPAQSETLLGHPAQIPTLPALWLHLLAHATYHLWQGRGRLIQLVDLTYLPAPDAATLNRVDARFIYPALALLARYFPNRLDPSLLAAQQQRVSPRFQRWVAELNLVNTSYLNRAASGPYFRRALQFADGNASDIFQAVRFSFLPTPAEMALDNPGLPTPWLGYLLLPRTWLKRLWLR